MNSGPGNLNSAKAEPLPLVAVIMGSDSDLTTMKPAIEVLEKFGITVEVRILSAHRTPLEMVRFGEEAQAKGIKVIIAGAGGAAHLPGMIASLTAIPVIGVPVQSKALNGVDSMYSILQMPGGIPVATVAIGGGLNAGLLAAQILATANSNIYEQVTAYRQSLHQEVITKDKKLVDLGVKNYMSQMHNT